MLNKNTNITNNSTDNNFPYKNNLRTRILAMFLALSSTFNTVEAMEANTWPEIEVFNGNCEKFQAELEKSLEAFDPYNGLLHLTLYKIKKEYNIYIIFIKSCNNLCKTITNILIDTIRNMGEKITIDSTKKVDEKYIYFMGKLFELIIESKYSNKVPSSNDEKFPEDVDFTLVTLLHKSAVTINKKRNNYKNKKDKEIFDTYANISHYLRYHIMEITQSPQHKNDPRYEQIRQDILYGTRKFPLSHLE